MRKITFGGASSLDAYFARLDDSVDWLMPAEESTEITRDYWRGVDTVLRGRKAYEIRAKSKRGAGTPGLTTYVFSRTLKEVDDKHVTLVKDDAVAFVRALKAQPGKDVCLMGGGDFAASLLEAGLVDELGFSIHPVLLGA